MQLSFATKPDPRATQVRFFTTSDEPPRGITTAEFSRKVASRVFLHSENLLCVGLGEKSAVDGEAVRRACGAAAMMLPKSGRPRLSVDLGAWAAHAGAAVEGLVLGDSRFEDFKSKKTAVIERAVVVVPSASLAAAKRAGERAKNVADMTNLARRIANQPGNIVFPATLAEQAQWHARRFGLSCTILDDRKLRAGKFGGILAVGQGSARPPRLIVLEHRGGPRGQTPIALVGKAVTFDTGGISIKPATDMEEMIWDKCGGVAVLGAMFAIAKLKLKRNVVGLIPAAENMPGAASYRPGDIVRCYDGKYVEIINTDAEGRMILADAIGYARLVKKAARIVDIATLTGACGVALGSYAAGLWSSDDNMRDALISAGEQAGERLWPMPLYREYEEQIQSEPALIKNTGGRLGGACTAAAFLKTFAEKTPWAHVDIAYTAHTGKDSAWLARGATGFGVRTLVNFAEGSKA